MSSWRGAQLSIGYVFIAWCLVKQWMSSLRGAYLSNGCLHGMVLS